MRASIRVEGLKEVIATTGGMANAANRPERVLRSRPVRRELEQAAERRFRRGIRAASRGWTTEKQRRGLDSRRFRATGAAFDAVTRGRGPAARAIIFEGARGGVRFGVRPGRSDLYYLQAHATGYQAGGRRMPKRRVVVIDKAARDGIARLLLDTVLVEQRRQQLRRVR